jgi:hypothetical protein
MPKQDRNKGEKSAEADGIIPFWSPVFFGEENEDAADTPTVDLPVLIDQAKGRRSTRSQQSSTLRTILRLCYLL